MFWPGPVVLAMRLKLNRIHLQLGKEVISHKYTGTIHPLPRQWRTMTLVSVHWWNYWFLKSCTSWRCSNPIHQSIEPRRKPSSSPRHFLPNEPATGGLHWSTPFIAGASGVASRAYGWSPFAGHVCSWGPRDPSSAAATEPSSIGASGPLSGWLSPDLSGAKPCARRNACAPPMPCSW